MRPHEYSGLALCLCLGACAAQQADTAHAAASSAPVDLTLVDADGNRLALRELRGRRVLLFVFTTFDSASQLSLSPVSDLARRDKDLAVLGVAAQPDPEELLPLYKGALDVPFPLVFEPDNRVVSGQTALGAVPTVPLFLVLDEHGRIAGRHVGVATAAELEQLVAAGE